MKNDVEARNAWGCTKAQRTLSMTISAWDLLGELATTADLSRSEVLEVLIRVGTEEGFDAGQSKKELLDKVAVST